MTFRGGLGSLIGPYGGTPESERKRPKGLAWDAIGIVVLMLGLLLMLLVLCSDFTGPMLVVGTSLLLLQKQDPGSGRTAVQQRIIKGVYIFSVVLTLFTIYVGGVPIKWQARSNSLVVGVEMTMPESALGTTGRLEQDGSFWLTTDEWSSSINQGVIDLPPGQYELWIRRSAKELSVTLPLWVDTFRWLIVLLVVAIELILLLLESRLLTEIIFPSLPNSVRARPGLLKRVILPFLTIENIQYGGDEPYEDEGVVPGSDEGAPWKS